MRQPHRIATIGLLSVLVGGCASILERRMGPGGGGSAEPCEARYLELLKTNDCNGKRKLMDAHLAECWEAGGLSERFEPWGADWHFRDAIFGVGDCYRAAGLRGAAAEVYRQGLAKKDWLWDTNEGFMAHAVLRERLESLSRPPHVCLTYEEFKGKVRDMVALKDLEPLETVVGQVFKVGFYPGSSAPSPFADNRAVIRRWIPNSDLKIIFEENHCLLVGGWTGAPYKTYALCSGSEDGKCYSWEGFHAVDERIKRNTR